MNSIVSCTAVSCDHGPVLAGQSRSNPSDVLVCILECKELIIFDLPPHCFQIRCRDSQIQQMEEETEQLTQQVQDLEGKLTAEARDDSDGGRSNITDLNIKVNRLSRDLSTVQSQKKELEEKVTRLEAEKKSPMMMRRVDAFNTKPTSSRDSSPAVGRKFSPPTAGVRGTILTKASGKLTPLCTLSLL